MNQKQRTLDYLEHILEALKRIFEYTEGLSQESFLKDKFVQDAVIRNIEVIGEASRNIERSNPNFTMHYTEVPWEDMYLMRNLLSHGYFDIDFEIVWKTIEIDLPQLQEQVKIILAAYDESFP